MHDTIVTPVTPGTGEYPGTQIGKISHVSRMGYTWAVRMVRNGERLSRYFADSKYGGVHDAFEAARQQRDRWLNIYGEVDPIAKLNCPESRSKSILARSSTMVPGFSLVRKGDLRSHYLQINLKRADGSRLQRSISLLRYGLGHGVLMAYEFLSRHNNITTPQMYDMVDEYVRSGEVRPIAALMSYDKRVLGPHILQHKLLRPLVYRMISEDGIDPEAYCHGTPEERRVAYIRSYYTGHGSKGTPAQD